MASTTASSAPQILQIRAAERRDAAAIAAFGSVAFRRTYEDAVPKRLVDTVVGQTYTTTALERTIARCTREEGAHFLVAEDADERVVGYLHFDSAGSEPELHRIYVDPEQTGRGIGHLLVEELHRRLPAGSSYVLLVVAANTRAIRFYERHGLQRDHEVDAVQHYRDAMNVELPPAAEVPSLIMRYRA